VVTGGGRGARRACALELARRGAAVAVLARSAEQLERVAEQVRAAGGRSLARVCDVTDRGQVEAALAAVRDQLGPITVLVAAAGVAHGAPFLETSDADWEEHLRTNATGVFYAVRAALPDMLALGWGRVVVVASTASKVGFRYAAAYAASKHAVLGLVRSVAAEFADRGITANAVCPGYLETAMTQANIQWISQRTGRTPEEVRRILAGTSPQGRLFRPEEVACLVAYLCTDAAGGINGQAIVLDGGGVMA